ncbi:hypothetical protein FXO38_01303 [Capsicum annuum]|nr:hypothetical protein FXO37_34810 [Capsicum annuum]KAF3682407.1 hypothetical protein FXO38_01303 [Capsicum annuum]
MASSSSSKPKNEIHRLAMSDFLPNKVAKLRPLIKEDKPQKHRFLPDKNRQALQEKAIQLLDSPNHDAIQHLITNLESSDDSKALYDFCKSNYPNGLSLKLSKLLLHSPGNASEIKSKCACLLHSLLDSPRNSTSAWSISSHMIREELKTAILEILKQDNPDEVCKLMWRTASQIFGCILIEDQGEWPDMLSFFLESLDSCLLFVQDRAALFFLELPPCLGEELSQSVEEIHLKLWNKFNSSDGMRKVLALAALVNLVQHMSSDYYSKFHDMLMPMIEGVSGFLENEIEEENAQKSLKKLVELAGAEPRFFDLHLNQVFDTMLTICENDKLEEETRYLAVEMMYAFDDISIKRVGEMILGRLSSVLVRMISLIPEGSSNYLLGEKFMYRLPMVRGEDMNFLLNEIQKERDSSEWRRRYAAVTIIRIIAKGCAKAMSDNLEEVINVVLKSMLDSSFDAGAASAMSSLCLSCRSYILEPRLQAIVSKLLQLIKSPSPEVHAESLNALASVAITSKDLFSTYYDSVITSLKKLLDDATSKSVQNNTVKLHLDNAVECIWTVAIAVGKDIFKKDAAEVMVLLLSVRLSLGEDNHSAKLTLLRAWDQLLQCLGSDFYPYMEDLIPDLLRSARLGSDSGTERVILTEKLRACELLLRLARQFKGMFSPWIDQVSETLIPLVTFHDEDIRKIAVSAMPRLLLSAKLAIETKEAPGLTNSHSHKLVVQIVPSLLEALDEETDGKNCAKILRSLTKCIEIAGAFLSKEQIQLTATGIEQVLEATSESHFSKEETVTELEKEIIKEVVNYFRILIKIYKECSSTVVKKFMECIKAMMVDDVTDKEKQIGLLTFNEFSLECPEVAIR